MKQKILTGESTKKTNRKTTNTYDLSGEFGIGYTSKGEEFYFDLEDYDKIKDYSWYMHSNGYIVANTNGTKVFQHRIIMDAPDNTLVDHIYHNKVDNRKSVLRLVNNSQNQMNSITRKHSSPYKGVSWSRNEKKWIAQIGINHSLIYLGRFANLEDAVSARRKAEEEYFGKYMCNFAYHDEHN